MSLVLTARAAAARIRLRQLRALTLKELRQLVRDRVLFGFVFYIFTLHIIVSTTGVSADLRHARVLARDSDHSSASREFLYGLRAPYFEVSREVGSAREGLRGLDDSSARMFVDVPEHFERDMRGNGTAKVQVFVDSSKVSLGFLASSYVTRRAQRYASEVASERLLLLGIDPRSLPAIENRQRTWYNFALNDRWPASLSILLMMMTVSCVMLPTAAALREKERGTIEQLLVSPLTPLQIMVSKIAAMTLVTVAGSVLSIYAVMQPLFSLPMRGSAVVFFAMVALFAVTTAGLGLALATFARTSGQAGLLVILTVMPMIQLSGTYSPIESMPTLLRYAVNVLPLYHFMQVAYGIVFRGAGLLDVWPHVVAMSAIGAGLFVLGWWRFGRLELASR